MAMAFVAASVLFLLIRWRLGHRHRRTTEQRASYHASSVQTMFSSRRPATMTMRRRRSAKRW